MLIDKKDMLFHIPRVSCCRIIQLCIGRGELYTDRQRSEEIDNKCWLVKDDKMKNIDIAKATEFSIATVSNALNQRTEMVSQENMETDKNSRPIQS